MRAQYEWQSRSKAEEIHEMQKRVEQLELEASQAQKTMDAERRKLLRQVSSYRMLLERYCIPPEEANLVSFDAEEEIEDDFEDRSLSHDLDSHSAEQWEVNGSGNLQGIAGNPSKGGFTAMPSMPLDGSNEGFDNTLASKMRQLNNLLQGSAGQKRQLAHDVQHTTPIGGNTVQEPSMLTSGAIASTLQAMFPHATIRTGRSDAENDDFENTQQETSKGHSSATDTDAKDVELHMRRLERTVDSKVDDRALMSLQSLPVKDAREALRKIEELVASQGGHCRNLSSILQSVCRKLEKRTKPNEPFVSRPNQSAFVRQADTTPDQRRGIRKLDEDEDAFEIEPSKVGQKVKSRPPEILNTLFARTTSPTGSNLDTPAGKKSWADIGDHEDDVEEESVHLNSQVELPEDPWPTIKLESVARAGFDISRKGERCDVLSIRLANLEPQLTENAMERYCEWLKTRLTAISKEQGGLERLQHCQAEVDFSQNRLSNQMVWQLLETLAQFEVHVATLNLAANSISQGGILAICEFIRMTEQAEATYELNLSSNEIDDDSALELLRTIHTLRPRYPLLLKSEETKQLVQTPFWIQLSNNRIRNPEQVLRTAEAEGITICLANDKQVCSRWRCCENQCPLVHLIAFECQAQSYTEAMTSEDREGGDTRSQRRRRDKKREKA